MPVIEAPAVLPKQRSIVMLDRSEDDVLKPYYCHGCGSVAFEYYGGVKFIMPGFVEREWLDVVGKPNVIYCKNRFRRMAPDGREIRGKCKVVYQIIG